MAISVNVGFPTGSDKPSVQLTMGPEDAISIIGELGKIANEDTALTSQLLSLLKDAMIKQL